MATFLPPHTRTSSPIIQIIQPAAAIAGKLENWGSSSNWQSFMASFSGPGPRLLSWHADSDTD